MFGEYEWYTARSGLPATEALSSHKRAVFLAALGAYPQFTAADSISDLEHAYYTRNAGAVFGNYDDDRKAYYTALAVRTNLVMYAGAENNAITGYFATINATVTTPTTQPRTGARSYEVVTLGVGTNEGLVQSHTAMATDGVAGAGFISFWIFAPVGATFTATMSEYTPAGGFVGNRASTPIVGTGAWQRITLTGSKSVGSNVLKWQVTTSGTPQALTFYVDDVAHGTGSSAWNFFDGNTADAGGFDYAFTGATDASTSTRTVIGYDKMSVSDLMVSYFAQG